MAPATAAQSESVTHFSDLTGPRGRPRDGYDSPHSFPDSEIETRPRDKYTAAAFLTAYALAAGSYVVCHDDDIRHQFWQFHVAPEDMWLCVFYIII
jgi:hypothetical protein